MECSVGESNMTRPAVNVGYAHPPPPVNQQQILMQQQQQVYLEQQLLQQQQHQLVLQQNPPPAGQPQFTPMGPPTMLPPRAAPPAQMTHQENPYCHLVNFEIEKKIGRGQFSVVYRARCKQNALVVALKKVQVRRRKQKFLIFELFRT